MVWGTYLEKFKWAICLIEGGSKCLPGWFGALIYIDKNCPVQMGICLFSLSLSPPRGSSEEDEEEMEADETA